MFIFFVFRFFQDERWRGIPQYVEIYIYMYIHMLHIYIYECVCVSVIYIYALYYMTTPKNRVIFKVKLLVWEMVAYDISIE